MDGQRSVYGTSDDVNAFSAQTSSLAILSTRLFGGELISNAAIALIAKHAVRTIELFVGSDIAAE
jgi:hypothetical protein